MFDFVVPERLVNLVETLVETLRHHAHMRDRVAPCLDKPEWRIAKGVDGKLYGYPPEGAGWPTERMLQGCSSFDMERPLQVEIYDGVVIAKKCVSQNDLEKAKVDDVLGNSNPTITTITWR